MKLTGGLLVAEEYTIISKRTMAIKVTWLNPPAVYLNVGPPMPA